MSETSPAYSANWEARAMHLAAMRDKARWELIDALKALPHGYFCGTPGAERCLCTSALAWRHIMTALTVLEDPPAEPPMPADPPVVTGHGLGPGESR